MNSKCLRVRVYDRKVLIQVMGEDPESLMEDQEKVQKILRTIGKEMGVSYLNMTQDAHDIGIEHDHPDYIVRVSGDQINVLSII